MITKIEENEGVMTVYLEGRLVAGTGTWVGRWDRYLGMTAAMTQVPVPTATLRNN